jgi:HNH endonuclease
MSARRRNSPVMPLSSSVLPLAAVWGWIDLHEPAAGVGFGLFVLPALVLGVMTPGALVSIHSLPLLLIPDRTRIWWRHGKARPAWHAWLKRAVMAADRYRCCYCGSPEHLQIDHVKPWSRGGLSALWNLTILCARCNRVKSNYWVARDGYVFYRPFSDANDQALAAEILRHELRHRWNPGRWIRAGWSINPVI